MTHVVCYQWQSRSEKLKWSLVFERGSTNANYYSSDNTTPPKKGSYNNSPSLPEDVVDAASETTGFGTPPKDDMSDFGSEDGNADTQRWGGDLAVPDDDNSDDAMSVAIASAASQALANASLAFSAPETWSPAELVPGADKALGPVREAWCLVPPGARVSLRCDLVSGRPLVRARSARFRLAAIRADDFFGDHGHLRDVANIAGHVGWFVAKDQMTFPPADAADFCAKKQLLQKDRSPRDLLDAYLRVDALNATTFNNINSVQGLWDAPGCSAFVGGGGSHHHGSSALGAGSAPASSEPTSLSSFTFLY